MDYERFIFVFTSIIYEALPFIVLGVVIAGILEEFVPQQFVARIIPRNRTLAIGMGGLLGGIFPMCECGIVPIMRRLLRKGLPLSVCVSYMLAGPTVNIVVLLSTYVAFTNESIFGSALAVVGLRAGLVYLTAFITALIVEGQYRKHGNSLLAPMVVRGLNAAEDNEPQPRRPLSQRLNNISTTALSDFIDIMAFLILGASLAAAGRAAMEGMSQQRPAINGEIELVGANGTQAIKVASVNDPGDELQAGDIILKAQGKKIQSMEDLERALRGKKPTENASLTVLREQNEEIIETRLGARRDVHPFVTVIETNPLVSILLMMAIAVIFCLCSEADAFVAANFPPMWPAASKMAFLVLGPMMDIKLYLLYTRIFRSRLIWTIISAVVVQVLVYCLILHYVTEYPIFWTP